MLTDRHREQIKNIIMEDYDVRPSLADVLVRVFENATKRIIDEADSKANKTINQSMKGE